MGREMIDYLAVITNEWIDGLIDKRARGGMLHFTYLLYYTPTITIEFLYFFPLYKYDISTSHKLLILS